VRTNLPPTSRSPQSAPRNRLDSRSGRQHIPGGTVGGPRRRHRLSMTAPGDRGPHARRRLRWHGPGRVCARLMAIVLAMVVPSPTSPSSPGIWCGRCWITIDLMVIYALATNRRQRAEQRSGVEDAQLPERRQVERDPAICSRPRDGAVTECPAHADPGDEDHHRSVQAITAQCRSSRPGDAGARRGTFTRSTEPRGGRDVGRL
jgi:hypothetical protein